MFILYLQPLHVIFMVSWFAAIFFLGRMYIYHQQELESDTPNQGIIDLCEKAERRLVYIILIPSLLFTTIIGFALMYYTNAFREGWFHLKFSLVLLFFYYNHRLVKLRKLFLQKQPVMSSWKLRIFNEIPFLFLVSIVFTVYLKGLFSSLWAAIMVVVVILFILLSLFVYRNHKKKAARSTEQDIK